MPVDIKAKSVSELKTLIANYERAKKTSAPLYAELLAELAERSRAGLSFERTIGLIRRAATERRFVSYGDVMEESGLSASRARLAVPKHLEALNARALQRGWPLLSAVVVTKDHVEDGQMSEDTLAGFCKSAENLGLVISDRAAFLRAQQEAVFDAAREGRLG